MYYGSSRRRHAPSSSPSSPKRHITCNTKVPIAAQQAAPPPPISNATAHQLRAPKWVDGFAFCGSPIGVVCFCGYRPTEAFGFALTTKWGAWFTV
ncbi:hypothetical protein Tco_0687075 [Tanacetum coccineum]